MAALLSVQLKQLHGPKQSLTPFSTWMFAFTVTLSPCRERHRPHTAAHTTTATHAHWFLNNVKITDTCPSPLTPSKWRACSVLSSSECLCECKMGHIPDRGISCVKCSRPACQGLLLNYQSTSHPFNVLTFYHISVFFNPFQAKLRKYNCLPTSIICYTVS